MTFYLVTDPDTGDEIWLTWEDTAEARIYAYSPNLGMFVRHSSLYQDFYWDMDLKYQPIDVDEAARIVDEGRIGKLDARTHQRSVLDWLKSVEDRKGPAELLGTSRIRPVAVSARQAATARAQRVRAATPGKWVTWKQYSPEHKQRAYVAANDLRNGKVRALAGVPIDVRLAQDEQGRVLVQVSRSSPSDSSEIVMS